MAVGHLPLGDRRVVRHNDLNAVVGNLGDVRAAVDSGVNAVGALAEALGVGKEDFLRVIDRAHGLGNGKAPFGLGVRDGPAREAVHSCHGELWQGPGGFATLRGLFLLS